MIAQATALALACIPGITGEVHNGEAVVVLVAVFIGKGVKTNID